MTIDTKTELLRYKLLHQRYDYDMEVYNLVAYGELSDEISRIDELSFSFMVDLENEKITPRQFLVYINEFVRYMKLYFYNMATFQVSLRVIVRGNKEELNVLLDCKCDDPYNCFGIKNNEKIKECCYKLIIASFIKNADYVPIIKTILDENSIKLKEVKDYNLKESEKILNLLSDIVFAQRGRGITMELFESIDTNLKEHLERKSKSKSKKYTIEDYKKRYIDSYIKNYEKIFKAYNIRKKYLRYFI